MNNTEQQIERAKEVSLESFKDWYLDRLWADSARRLELDSLTFSLPEILQRIQGQPDKDELDRLCNLYYEIL